MKLKKSPKADLEKKKTLFLQTGFIISLALALLAFEWKSYEKLDIDIPDRTPFNVPEEKIPVPEDKKLPPPPEPPKTTTEIVIVDNDVDVEDKVDIDVNMDFDEALPKWTPSLPDEVAVEGNEPFIAVEENPQFPGGNTARVRYLANNIKYPKTARELGIQGTVYLSFIVEKDGSVTNVEILRGIGYGCDEEALRVVRDMPKWKPGKQREKPVRVQFSMPVRFVLQ